MPKSKKFNTEVIQRRQLKKGGKQTTLKISKKKGRIDYEEIEGILTQFEKAADSNVQTLVRVPTAIGIRTVKSFGNQLSADDYEDYFVNKVSDTSKFTEFEYIEITVFS